MTERTDRMPDSPGTAPFRVGAWRVRPEIGRLDDGDAEVALEPRLMALLELLASAPGRVFSRESIERALWPDVVVGEDTLARTVSRLRRALGDSAQSPRYIETLPKRGYRLIEPVAPIGPDASADDSAPALARRVVFVTVALAAIALLFVGWRATTSTVPGDDPYAQQVSRADDLYMRFTRADNEAAIGLYERVIAAQPDNAAAQAGLANALVQRVVRWPRRADAAGASSLTEALDRGLTRGPEAEAVLGRAAAMAERAVRLAPDDPGALKALGFVETARGDLERATELYERVLALDDDAWAALINLGEIEAMRGDTRATVARFEQAWAAMARAYEYEPQRVGPWQVALGVAIGEYYEQLGQPVDAELWYRRALAEAPYEPEATVRLARLLRASGEAGEADALCLALIERIGGYPGCPVAP